MEESSEVEASGFPELPKEKGPPEGHSGRHSGASCPERELALLTV